MEAAASLGSSPPSPTHVAIIMDGNGRWAKARSLPRLAGHKQGAEVVRKTVTHCQELGISYLTLFAFSSENWKRPLAEIDDLMGLLRIYLERELSALVRNGVRLRFIGDRQRLPQDIIALLDDSEQRTHPCWKMKRCRTGSRVAGTSPRHFPGWIQFLETRSLPVVFRYPCRPLA